MKETFSRYCFISLITLIAATLVSCGSGNGSNSSSSDSSTSNNEAITSTFAYINTSNPANRQDNLSICTIEKNGQLGSCSSQDLKVTGNIALFNNNANAVFGQESKVTLCQVTKDNGIFYNCNNVNTNISFKHNVYIIGFIKNFLYIIDGSLSKEPIVYSCIIDSQHSAMNCNTILEDLTQPISMTLDKNNNRIYFITKYIKNSQINVCDIDSTDGELAKCDIANDGIEAQSFDYSWNLLVDPSSKYMYVLNTSNIYGNGSVSLCTIDQSSGKYTKCKTTGNGLSYPHDMALDPTGDFAYFVNTDATSSNISFCTRDIETGELNNCTYTGNGLYMPTWISTFN